MRDSNRKYAFLYALVAALLLPALSGCPGTTQAYRAARDAPDPVYAMASVVAEHYLAVTREAANIAESYPEQPVVARELHQAQLQTRPAFDALKAATDAYVQAKGAQTQEALQAAVNDAVRALSRLIESVNARRKKGGV